MPYQKLELPDGTPNELESLVRGQVDPLLADVHSMLRLPQEGVPGLDAACNLSSALVLLAVVSGVSAELCDNPSLNKSTKSGPRFKLALTAYFPWSEEPNTVGAVIGGDAAKLLYKAFRNPLAHNLGVVYDKNYVANRKVAAKDRLSDEEIERLENSYSRPKEWVEPTLRIVSSVDGSQPKTRLAVDQFYWGVRRMIWNVLSDRVVASAQEAAPSPVALTSQAKQRLTTVVGSLGQSFIRSSTATEEPGDM